MVRFRPWPPFPRADRSPTRDLSARGMWPSDGGDRTIAWFGHFETPLPLSFTLLACRFDKRIGVRTVRRHVKCLRKDIRANPSLATMRRRRRRRVSDNRRGWVRSNHCTVRSLRNTHCLVSSLPACPIASARALERHPNESIPGHDETPKTARSILLVGPDGAIEPLYGSVV